VRRHITIREWLKLVHADDRRDFVQQARLQNNQTDTYHEIQTRFLCGHTYKWLLSKTAIVKKDVTGKIVRLAGYLTDVTSRRMAAEAADDRHKRYLQSFEIAADNAWEHDFRTNTTLFAGGINEILGYGNAETGDHKQLWWNSMHPDDLPTLEENDRKYRAGLIDNHQLEYRLIARDGKVKWVLDRGAVIERDASGKPARIIGMHKDITERKAIENALEESERRFSDLAQSVPGVIYQWEENFDGTFGFTYVSPKLKEYFDLEPEQMHLVSSMIHPDDERRWRQSIEHANRTGEPWRFEGRLLYPDGSIKWWRGSSTLSCITSKGRVYNGILIDITPDQVAKQMIHESEERFKAIFNSMFQLMIMLTPDGTVLEANNAALEFAGVEFDEVHGRNIAHIVRHMYNDEQLLQLQDLLQQAREGKFVRFETRALDRNGENAWLDFSIQPVRDADDNVVRLLTEARNITAQKLLQKKIAFQEREKKEAIVEAVIQAQEREREQISVELHDNVNQILSSSRLMLDVAELYPEKTIELVNESKQNVDKAIEEIRKISYSLNPCTVAYVGVCSAITDMVEQVKLTGVLDVMLEIKGDWKEVSVDGDVELALFRIAQEQLNNIIRHANATTVHISLTMRPTSINIRIVDDGNGFNPQSLKKGLGLRNIHNRIEHYHGTMVLESEPGKGCMLQAVLPIKKGNRVEGSL
jgi:PAS domain S-box-containing protein